MPPLGPRVQTKASRKQQALAYQARERNLALQAAVPPHGGQERMTQAAQTHHAFRTEGPQHYAGAFHQNEQYAKSGPYQTRLSPLSEQAFRRWVQQEKIPFAPNAKTVDYDMRGYFKATGGPSHGQGQHFPDTFKTPYDTTFSDESKYATPDNPFEWVGDRLVNRATGEIIFTPRRG